MSDILATFYPWIKTLHIISVISWMAGLLYLPRLFVNHVEYAQVGSETSEIFKGMEERLTRIIMMPAMIATWIFGLILTFTPGVVNWTDIYPWIKAMLVIGMTLFHLWLIKVCKEFAIDKNERSSKSYRFANEVPTLMMILIVILIVVKPF